MDSFFLQQLFNGITLGAVYGLIAIGYTMVYGIIGMINFAHGEVYMISAYLCAIALALLSFFGQHFYDDNFSGEDFSTHYIVLGFRLRVSENDLQLPDIQHDAYRWLAIEEILASDHVHDNSRAYFCEKSQAGAPGL